MAKFFCMVIWELWWLYWLKQRLTYGLPEFCCPSQTKITVYPQQDDDVYDNAHHTEHDDPCTDIHLVESENKGITNFENWYLEHIKIFRGRKEAYRINLTRWFSQVLKDTKRRENSWKDIKKDETVGRWKKLRTFYSFTHSFSHPFIDLYQLKKLV